MKSLKVNFIYLFSLMLIIMSCSNEQIDSEPITQDFKEYSVILKTGEKISITKLNGNIVEDSNYLKLKEALNNMENTVILNSEDNIFQLFESVDDAKNKIKLDNESNFDENMRSLIQGEVKVYDGLNLTGTNSTFKMSYGDSKITWQLPSLTNMKTLYNSNGSTSGSTVNLNDKISSIELRNYSMVVLYSEAWFNPITFNFPFPPQQEGSIWIYANVPDLYGNPAQRTINLPDNPIYNIWGIGPESRSNRASSILATCDVN